MVRFWLVCQKWVKILYIEAKECIINNGFTSKYFKLYNEVRQGDSLSPFLFKIVAELSIDIKKYQ